MFVCVVSLSQMLYDKCLCVLSRYLRCFMINVCVCCCLRCCLLNVCVCCLVTSDVVCLVKCFVCVLSRYLRCCMINVCVRFLVIRCCMLNISVCFLVIWCCMINIYVCCLVISDVVLYVVSRYLRCLYDKSYDKCLCVFCVWSRMINVCVCCLVISDVVWYIFHVWCLVISYVVRLMSVCVVSLSLKSYAKCLCVLSRHLWSRMINVYVCCLVISDVVL